MDKNVYQRAINSPHWWKLKDAARARAENRCEHCFEVWYHDGPGSIRCPNQDNLQLHHRHYLTLGRETLDDVELVCDRCHCLLTLQRYECSCCGESVFGDYAEAKAWLQERQEEMPRLSVAAILKSYPPPELCGHCSDRWNQAMSKD